jgi:hypothetical protein
MMPDANIDPVWGCLGHVMPGMPQSGLVSVSLPFYDLVSMKTRTGVGVRACNRLDVNCDRPVNSTLAVADPMGIARLQVPSGFDGYGQIIEVNDAGTPVVYDAGSGDAGADADASFMPPPGSYIPSVVFFTPPIIRDLDYGIVPIFHYDEIDVLAVAQGNTWNRGYGLVFIGTLDCSRKPAAGVTWEPNVIDPLQKRFYYVNGLPSEEATATDSTGFGGLLNAKPGSIIITATLQATGTRVGSATVLVKPGAASYIYLPPTP